MNRLISSFCCVTGLVALAAIGGAAAPPACDADNGGITLPQRFCAAVVATDVGPARHLVVAPNGDVFVSTEGGRGGDGGVVALRDTDGDGKLDRREKFGEGSVTGIALRNGYIYYATTNSIVRSKLAAGEMRPSGPVEVIAEGLIDQRQHADKGLAFDGKGGVTTSHSCRLPTASRDVTKCLPTGLRGRRH